MTLIVVSQCSYKDSLSSTPTEDECGFMSVGGELPALTWVVFTKFHLKLLKGTFLVLYRAARMAMCFCGR